MTSTGGNPARFTGRVDSYKRFRPGYPKASLDLLRHDCGLTSQSAIVDVAAGTGLFSELFLENGNPVIAIEPNDEMRAVCRDLHTLYPEFTVFDGTAETTGLPAASADFLTVAQAMHWFDLKQVKKEFLRVLRPKGWCVVAYNERRDARNAFHQGFEDILVNFGSDYKHVQRTHLAEEQLRAFFAPFPLHRHILPNAQFLDLEALAGRIVSSSYMPTITHPRYAEMERAIERLFNDNQREGFVRIDYDCAISYGQLSLNPV